MIPITDVKTMRKSDADTIKGGVHARELMVRAGRGIFESYRWQGPVAIVCGCGNNAGDGYVLALELAEVGVKCTLVLLEERFSEDGKYYYECCTKKDIPSLVYTSDFSFSPYTEIADCIFGTGFSGDVTGLAAEVIERINTSGKKVISADINSGLNGDSGIGTRCVKSDLTVSVGSYKTGHFLGDAKDVIGRLVNIDIGIKVPCGNAYLCEPTDFSDVLKPRRQNSHKGTYGYVTVLGGCPEYAGAVKLANMSASALRAGCGVAQLAVPDAIAHSVSPYLLESTLLPIPSDSTGHMKHEPAILDSLLSRMAAIAVGMGWGTAEANCEILAHLLSRGACSLVIDADGLNTLSKMDLTLLKNTSCRVVITPHLKEFERLCGVPMHEILDSPILHAQRFAREYGVCVLLKGCTTVVTDGETVYLVDRGCAGMATAGSGDVLSGILAGLLGYAPMTAKTIACGAYIAGLAGELAERDSNPISMLSSDTVAHIPAAISEMIKQS
ncbi:MAG: NAD(P)H-hydrate dehydratase [Ruminococcaceae bacterium]|nr:NAD(P)H-hydrate dehydratase [Oscillospiraceae bacterium]